MGVVPMSWVLCPRSYDMIITCQGGSYFRIQSGSFTLLINPTNARSFKGAQIALHTETPPLMEAPEEEEEEGLFWIENAGEYEIGGVRIEGWNAETKKGKTINAYRAEIEDIEVGVVGPLAETPSAEAIEGLGEVDILITPAEAGVKMVRQIEPGIVIPYGEESGIKKFFAELSQNPKPEEKLVIKKKEVAAGKIMGIWIKA